MNEQERLAMESFLRRRLQNPRDVPISRLPTPAACVRRSGYLGGWPINIDHLNIAGATNTLSGVATFNMLKRPARRPEYDYVLLVGSAGGIEKHTAVGDFVCVDNFQYIEWGKVVLQSCMQDEPSCPRLPGNTGPDCLCPGRTSDVTFKVKSGGLLAGTGAFSLSLDLQQALGIRLCTAVAVDKVIKIKPSWFTPAEDTYLGQLASGTYDLVEMEVYGFHAAVSALGQAANALALRVVTDMCSNKEALGDPHQRRTLEAAFEREMPRLLTWLAAGTPEKPSRETGLGGRSRAFVSEFVKAFSGLLRSSRPDFGRAVQHLAADKKRNDDWSGHAAFDSRLLERVAAAAHVWLFHGPGERGPFSVFQGAEREAQEAMVLDLLGQPTNGFADSDWDSEAEQDAAERAKELQKWNQRVDDGHSRLVSFLQAIERYDRQPELDA